MSHEGANFGVGGGGVGGGREAVLEVSVQTWGRSVTTESVRRRNWNHGDSLDSARGWLVRSRRRTWSCKEVVGFGVFESEGCGGCSFAYAYALIPCVR